MKMSDKRDLIVVRVDGGICSQICFIALGRQLQRCGHRVKYDLSWFRNVGKDLTGNFIRRYDFPLAFPALHVEEARADEVDALKRLRICKGVNIDSFSPPLYIGGYPPREGALLSQLTDLREAFRPELDQGMTELMGRISDAHACAVHVRRGDLANGNPCYGGATTKEYFCKAMRMICSLCPEVRFFFFSDEPNWARDNLLRSGGRDEVVDINGSDKGYLDLYAMSRCEYVISSIGSLGVFAALLSSVNRILVMSHRRDWVSSGMANVIYINDDFGREAIRWEYDWTRNIPEPWLHGLRGRFIAVCGRFGSLIEDPGRNS